MKKNLKLKKYIMVLVLIIVIIILIIKFYNDYTNYLAIQEQPIDMDIGFFTQFNSQFTMYEGIITGSKVQNLIRTTEITNKKYDGTDVIVTINNIIPADTSNVIIRKQSKI